MGYLLLVACTERSRSVGCWLLVVGCWLPALSVVEVLVVGCWLPALSVVEVLVVGCLLFVVCCLLLCVVLY